MRSLICIPVYHILGAHLIERLVLLNSLRLRSWRVRLNMTDPELREILLTIRQLELKNILLYTSELPEYKLLNLVSVAFSSLQSNWVAIWEMFYLRTLQMSWATLDIWNFPCIGIVFKLMSMRGLTKFRQRYFAVIPTVLVPCNQFNYFVLFHLLGRRFVSVCSQLITAGYYQTW